MVADKIVFTAAKTKDAVSFLQGLGVAESRRVLVIMASYDETGYKCFRNLPNVTVRPAPAGDGSTKTVAFSTRDLLVAHKIVISADALKAVEAVWSAEVKEPTAKPEKVAKEKPVKAEKAPKAEAAPAKKAPAKKAAEPKAEAAPKKAPAKKKAEGGDK